MIRPDEVLIKPMPTNYTPGQKVVLNANKAPGTVIEVRVGVNLVYRYLVRYVLADNVIRDVIGWLTRKSSAPRLQNLKTHPNARFRRKLQ